MYIHHTQSLFAWGCLADSPSLRTVRQALAMLPDGKLLESLRGARGKGRDDYPVEVLGRDPHRTLLHEMFDAMVGGGSGGIDGRGRDGAQRPAPFGSGRAGGPWPTIRRRIPTTSTPS